MPSRIKAGVRLSATQAGCQSDLLSDDLHSDLCLVQSCLWHSAPQYCKAALATKSAYLFAVTTAPSIGMNVGAAKVNSVHF
ncbi:hypothetical protein IF1G_11140 [Cordyceps javanica]|uniref:Uncharacterized protein n=1 Tax=Cordyceps javanica TaxID=43265 RepID=A0A545VIL8_9HYPO|nr:hypothetical protein IF1G_11140 [Cordyceps javanica]TQW01496.1 hypothetical protein IF2G_10987 [Cordyceps javanica]